MDINNFLNFPYQYRPDFPCLDQKIGDYPLVYFDNAATSLKPKSVILAMEEYYEKDCANIHRGVHQLSIRATHLFESAREKVQNFIHAKHSHEIIVTKSNTESINLVASSLSKFYFREGDEILLTKMEHHSNIVPWKLLESIGVKVQVANLTSTGEVDWVDWESKLNEKTKLVGIVYISNTLGVINPIKEKIKLAHQKNALVLIDAAQAPLHLTIDVQDLDVDFLTLSPHKMLAPTGVGILYGKSELLNKMPPYQGGGDMIKHVSFDKIIYADLPSKFEAGTLPISSMIGLGAAIDYIQKIGVSTLSEYQHHLTNYLLERLIELPFIHVMAHSKPSLKMNRSGNISFVMYSNTQDFSPANMIHPHDIGTVLDEYGIAIRVGHHCTYPIMEHFNLPATSRASLSFYNTKEEVDFFIKSLSTLKGIFS